MDRVDKKNEEEKQEPVVLALDAGQSHWSLTLPAPPRPDARRVRPRSGA